MEFPIVAIIMAMGMITMNTATFPAVINMAPILMTAALILDAIAERQVKQELIQEAITQADATGEGATKRMFLSYYGMKSHAISRLFDKDVKKRQVSKRIQQKRGW